MTSVRTRSARIPLPISLPWLLLLVAAYLLPGLAGHDPWKTDDAISFGIVLEALHGNWLVPNLAGEPYAPASPLYFWIAAVFAKLFSGVLPLHDGARFASGFCTAFAIGCTALAARELYGAVAASTAALILIGCVGLLLHAHAMTAEIALFAALAATLYGLALASRRPLAAGIIAGCGIGAAFLAHGVAPAASSLLLAAIVSLGRSESRRHAAHFWAGLVPASLPWIAIWPAALFLTDTRQFAEWWAALNVGQLPVADNSQPFAQALGYLKLLGWYAWPSLPLALWTLWFYRLRLSHPGIVLPVCAFVVFLAMLSCGKDARDITALPLLLPLTLLGAASAGELRRGAANALDWFGMMTFSLLAVAVWAGYLAMITGVPADFAAFFTAQEPGFSARFDAAAMAVALVFSATWVALVTGTERSPYRGVTHWAAGMTLAWALLATLWLPWIDYGKSYRAMSASLQPHISKDGCVSSRNLGEPQRASLHYFSGLVTQRAEFRDKVRGTDCPMMLVQGSVKDDSGNPGTGWELVWQGNRPGDRSERYRFYRRLD